MLLRTRANIMSRALAKAGVVVALAACAPACTEVPVRQQVLPEEQQRIDQSLGQKLAESLEKNFVLRKDVDSEVYLRSIALRLVQVSPELKESPVGVLIFREPLAFREGPQKLRFLGLPGTRLYVALDFLKQVDYENELAAALALQLAHVKLRHIAKHLETASASTESAEGAGVLDQIFPPGEPKHDARLGDREVFHLSDDEMAESIDEAVRLLYSAGYDPRGLVEFWKRFQETPEESLYAADEIEAFIRQTYRSIARYTPLRNPVVRSGSFLAFKKRIAKS